MVLFVPEGNECDSTNHREEFEATASYLLRCGVIPLPSVVKGESEQVFQTMFS